MALGIGIVGLPSVGTSTLFNALVGSPTAQAANYPFCTIDPNVGVVPVPDGRLEKLSALFKPKKTTPTTLEFIDIAGLVAGASRGEGLGNQFLSHIRQMDAIAHVLRCFEDADVVHVAGTVDPAGDRDVVEAALAALDRVKSGLEQGLSLRSQKLGEDERGAVADLFLLTSKPVVYIANVDEEQLARPDERVRAVQAQAAGAIHTDFERGFIKAEVTRVEDLLALGSEQTVRERGLMRIEGKEYVV